MKILPSKKIRGDIKVPTDKSISHRSLILNGFANTSSVVRNILNSDDVKSSFTIMKGMGVKFKGDFNKLSIEPASRPESGPYYCGNSGTTVRLVSGLVSGYEGKYQFSGDDSLSLRPMKRISIPLTEMGSLFNWENEGYLPYTVNGSDSLNGIVFYNKKKSAQVKSAILLAGLNASGETTVIEDVPSRDHTERMLGYMGADIKTEDGKITIRKSEINGMDMQIPGDFSSSAFFLALCACHGNAELRIENVSLNPSRIAFLKLLKLMGGDVEIIEKNDDIEPYGVISIRTSDLKAVEVPETLIPNMIDEIPLVALLGCFAEGKTVVRNASELRVKESDRIAILCKNMRKIGVDIIEKEDGFELEGPQRITGGVVASHHDHRMAMLFSVCGLLSEEGVEVINPECCSISFPNFYELLKEITIEGV